MARKKKIKPKQLLKPAMNFPSLHENREATLPVDDLAKREGVSAPALAGMRIAYGWTSRTRMTREAFSQKARAWLGTGGK